MTTVVDPIFDLPQEREAKTPAEDKQLIMLLVMLLYTILIVEVLHLPASPAPIKLLTGLLPVASYIWNADRWTCTFAPEYAIPKAPAA